MFTVETRWRRVPQDQPLHWSGGSPFENACLEVFSDHAGELTIGFGDDRIPLSLQYDLKGVFFDLPGLLRRIAAGEQGPLYLQFTTGSGLDLLLTPDGDDLRILVEAGDGCGYEYARHDGLRARVGREAFLEAWRRVIDEVVIRALEVRPELREDPEIEAFRRA